jgi:hypothetical protein
MIAVLTRLSSGSCIAWALSVGYVHKRCLTLRHQEYVGMARDDKIAESPPLGWHTSEGARKERYHLGVFP